MANDMKQLELLPTAEQARSKYVKPEFVEAIVSVTHAILAASPLERSVSVTLPLALDNIPVKVRNALERLGYVCVLEPSWTDRTSTLIINWS